MKTAIITGASAGLGREFVKQLPELFPDIEEYWLVARNKDKLISAAKSVPVQCRIFPLDLTDDSSYKKIADYAAQMKPEVWMLINNAGMGYLGNVGEGDVERQTKMTDLNVKAPTAITHIFLPYMVKGACVLNVSSIASFCPNPRMTVYSSTKAYISSFTLGLSEELREKGITATAVCPGPMDTEFIYKGEIKGSSKTFDTLPYCDPGKVARGALIAAGLGKTVWTPTAFYKFYRLAAKITPVKIMMKFAKT